MKKYFVLLVILFSCSSNYDVLKKGDLVWIFDPEDSAFGRIATVVSDECGKGYFGQDSSCLIRFPESGNGCRGIFLSSIYKIHNNSELVKYLIIERRVLDKLDASDALWIEKSNRDLFEMRGLK